MEVARGVRSLTGGVVNFYRVEEGGRFTVVDAGTQKDLPLLIEATGGLDAVDTILLTHAHADHTGFAERVRADAGVTVRVHEADAETALTGRIKSREGSVWRHLVRPQAYRTLVSLTRRGGTKIVPIHEVSTFADGEALDVPGSPRAIHLPGHTDGAAGLFFEDRGVLFTGDSLITRNPLTGRLGPQIMPAYLNVSSARALDSLSRIEDVSAMTLLPGHGDPLARRNPRRRPSSPGGRDVMTFPAEGMELTRLLVVSDVERSRDWYTNVLGASEYRSYGGTSSVLKLLGSWLLLVTGGPPTPDKPTVEFAPPDEPDRVSAELIFRVPDCRAAHETLRGRGASFLAEPVDNGYETRAFFRDPDGHLFEISSIAGT